MIKFAAITPHPPVIVPAVGKSQTSKAQTTIEAMRKLRIRLNRLRGIDKIFVISPHLPSTWDAFAFFYDEKLQGNFADFGASEVKFEFANDRSDIELLKKIGGPIFPIISATIRGLDHGTLVPLYYLFGEGKHKKPLLPMSFCSLSFAEHYRFGQFLGEFFKQDNSAWAVIASGDLSHRLAPYAPAGYHPRAKEFDKKLIAWLEKGEVDKILSFNPELVTIAGECGLRSIILLLGIISSLYWKPKILSYEAPFGVGYLVAEMRLNS